jgi:hypothetical protein
MYMTALQKAPDTITKESTAYIGDKEYKVISIFQGKHTASKLLHDMAVSRVLYEHNPSMEYNGDDHE